MKSHRKTEGETERWKGGIRDGEKGTGTEWGARRRDAVISESGEDKQQNKAGDIHGKEIKRSHCVWVVGGALRHGNESMTRGQCQRREREREGESKMKRKKLGEGATHTHRETDTKFIVFIV